MRRLSVVLVTCLALLCCTSPAVHGGAQVREDGPGTGRRGYAYGPLPHQRLVAYGHAGTAVPGPRRTGVVIVHGGFWYQQRSAGWESWARRISGAGPVVFNLDYRPNTTAPWPAQRDDVLRALRWIGKRAGHFGVDPRRIVLVGSSAGGQLAAAAGVYGAGRRHLAGLVALSPVIDPYRSWKDAGEQGRGTPGMAQMRLNTARLAGCEPRTRPDGTARRYGSGAPEAGKGEARTSVPRRAALCLRVWRDMSAVHRASGRDDPPMLLVHSRHDFVPVWHSEALRAAELAHGMPPGEATVATVPGAAHGGGLLVTPGVERMVLNWIAARERTAAPDR
ncbi:acetyl esterase/lipase [Streptomyces sp. Amel2xB2]|uniref:alpha/beta hydrolase fold domain-containing protein n=1 Tax=Streptomyces sp. Amel2xB2 TaxID=1305829 RepID=UPI000DB9DB79|nr:alpha/beta hydrolase [Streptomyces sp. Amel2xB2]RAJ62585.1 acetyl esterase/lipase [Streptomyces sp. Amel2xB2]